MEICTIILNKTDLTGEYEYGNLVLTRGDSRIAMTIGRNNDTAQFGREQRFLIDDPASDDKLAYFLTKPLKVGKTYNNSGIYSFVLQETVSTENDNMELGIADYYKHFPDEKQNGKDDPGASGGSDDPSSSDGNGKKVWL